MTFRRRVENGVLKLDDPNRFPEGSMVELRLITLPPGPHHPDVERFASVIQGELCIEEEYFAYLKNKHQ